MKAHPDTIKALMAREGISYLEARKRLKGVTGPERQLVGESRSDEPQADVEEAKPGRRGVGEIVERNELVRLIDRTLDEARKLREEARAAGDDSKLKYFEGAVAALVIVMDRWERISAERSDLSNER